MAMAMAKVLATMVVMLLATCASEAVVSSLRPNPSDSPAMARWLVSQNDWGVLRAEEDEQPIHVPAVVNDVVCRVLDSFSTISVHLRGTPWGNIASYSDGPVGSSGGTPFFYLSKLDPTPIDIDSDPRCSLTISETSLGGCGSVDTENPTCARLTLSGKLKEITDKEELDFAAYALFSKHPEMPSWPKGHKWIFYKLDIEDIFLIDNYGGAKLLTVSEYYRGSVQAAVAR